MPELKQHKIALQELKTRLEEWDAKKKMFDTLHEELATVNERNAALMSEVEETRSALAASEAKPPTVVTATVTVVKVS